MRYHRANRSNTKPTTIPLANLPKAYDPFAVWAKGKTFPQIAATFAPYDKMPGFQRGHEDYMDGLHDNPFGSDGLPAQAWDRGHMAAALFIRTR